MVPFNLKVLAKFCLCSNCSQKLDECSLARARKIFATDCMLGFSLKFPYRVALTIICILDTGHNVSHIENWESLGKYARATIFLEKCFTGFLKFIETDRLGFSSRVTLHFACKGRGGGGGYL